ncbi:hypothetical protein HYQ46_010466 [Verticillium longisporum]|nr:hypothetical protein HYQ44_016853 [Verticillium longisporum]KAG7126475.1 hypothetical protein HYQ46_010466 [Verticillium longisporum]
MLRPTRTPHSAPYRRRRQSRSHPTPRPPNSTCQNIPPSTLLNFLDSTTTIAKITTNMIVRITSFANMGRGAYDTTGCPKPPPRPKPG